MMAAYLIRIINPQNPVWHQWGFDPTTLPESPIVMAEDEFSARCEALNLFEPNDCPVTFSELPEDHPLLIPTHTECVDISQPPK
ncbi:hypothetical protein ElyMa_005924600 [Elysia marginata]|uniref:Uncharacterized protein n=1 Tax=Elysia marginata TaxID=1093978 RepID=A0AAV4G7B3_9GAST|nr:hypothetical protein ElyMa_005924600 [Elysia marginata]